MTNVVPEVDFRGKAPLTGLSKNSRRLLVCLRDGKKYILPPGMQPDTQKATDHLTTVSAPLGAAGLIVATAVNAEGVVTDVALTAKGRAAAAHL